MCIYVLNVTSLMGPLNYCQDYCQVAFYHSVMVFSYMLFPSLNIIVLLGMIMRLHLVCNTDSGLLLLHSHSHLIHKQENTVVSIS